MFILLLIFMFQLQASTDKIGYPDIYERDADIDNIYQSVSDIQTIIEMSHVKRQITHAIADLTRVVNNGAFMYLYLIK